MILRVWRGWTESAGAYDSILRGEVAPGIVQRGLAGLSSFEVWSRVPEENRGEAEFLTTMQFTDLAAVAEFTGGDYRTSVVPERARRALSRYDSRSQHYQLRQTFIGPGEGR